MIYACMHVCMYVSNSTHCCFKIVGTDLGEQAVRLADCPRDSPTVIVLGNEGTVLIHDWIIRLFTRRYVRFVIIFVRSWSENQYPEAVFKAR